MKHEFTHTFNANYSVNKIVSMFYQFEKQVNENVGLL